MFKFFGKKSLVKKLKIEDETKLQFNNQEEDDQKDLKQSVKGECDPFLPCEICLCGGCLTALYGCWNCLFGCGQKNECCFGGSGGDCDNCCCCKKCCRCN